MDIILALTELVIQRCPTDRIFGTDVRVVNLHASIEVGCSTQDLKALQAVHHTAKLFSPQTQNGSAETLPVILPVTVTKS